MVRFSFCFFLLVLDTGKVLLLLVGEISSQLGSGPQITDVNIVLPPKMNSPVSLEAHIFPQNPVIHTGNLLNFTIAGTEHRISGQWVTSNRSVLSVNDASGQAKAISQGSAHVTFEGNGLKLQTKITVCPTNSKLLIDGVSETGPEEVNISLDSKHHQSFLEIVLFVIGVCLLHYFLIQILILFAMKIEQAKFEGENAKLEEENAAAKERNLNTSV